VLAREPNNTGATYLLGLVRLQQRDYPQAIGLFQKVYAQDKLLGAGPLGFAHAKAGRAEESARLLGELEARSTQGFVPALEKALIHIGLGDNDRAFATLWEASEERSSSFPFVMIDPLFDGIRSDPRYAELARSANLVR
jgi:tetratricopeptide (TPR) repeat protein